MNSTNIISAISPFSQPNHNIQKTLKPQYQQTQPSPSFRQFKWYFSKMKNTFKHPNRRQQHKQQTTETYFQ